jgi:(1->4)-alpha-D-glucan 1-alpha-D-glucosylmutase
MNPIPRATYRVQLQPEFGFSQATGIIAYLAELGVSHLFASPYLQARSGSTHGYDIVDPRRVNIELGGEEMHERLCRELKSAGLGQMIDIVPNHIAIAGRENPFWWDVLENGPSSRYAAFFDVDWDSSEERWPNKVLLPVLGDHYGRVLENGEITLSHREGVFIVHYHDHSFPVCPSSLAELLGNAAVQCGSAFLAYLADGCGRLPRPTATNRRIVEFRHRDQTIILELLGKLCRERADIGAAIDDEVKRISREADELDHLIDTQNYRLARWRMESRDLGYRRFFDIKELVGLRMENEEVFQTTHALPIAWIRQGLVQGLRIDHPDGLRNPTEYFERLRAACPDSWIVAEKILEEGEELPTYWPIEGSTGYDFLNLVGGLFIDPAGEAPLTAIYSRFTGEPIDFRQVVRSCKRHVLRELLASELSRLSGLFVEICERHRRFRDYMRLELHDALCETAVCFPVYRTYFSPGRAEGSEADGRHIETAIECARSARKDLEPELFDFLRDLLLFRYDDVQERELALRFQQLTGPAMAKGVEDTAFYRFNRLVVLNEVGGAPARFGTTTEQFHAYCAEAHKKRPLSLLSTTTHDTKRSEDVRARLALLSEIPRRWGEAVERWSRGNEQFRQGTVPDRNTEYLLYQTLVGAWPIGFDRISAYMEKAVREAKMHTSWIRQEESYEQSLRAFIKAVMAGHEFRSDLEKFVEDLVLPGRLNSLAQTLLKLTVPGIPDIYQGNELWDLSLVDPDNRRAVDFNLRRDMLDQISSLTPEEILQRMDEGLPKLHVIRQALYLRRRRPELFSPEEGSYRALYAEGDAANHVVAYLRGGKALTIVPRLVMQFGGDWKNTAVEVPEGRWHNVMTKETLATRSGGRMRLRTILERFPVALLVKEGDEHDPNEGLGSLGESGRTGL